MNQPSSIRSRARELRKNATREENHLWYDFLKTYPVRFRRQVPFDPYIVDFYCEKAGLAIELDGSQHYEDKGLEVDKARSRYLKEVYHIDILRFSNLDIARNFEGVCQRIDQVVGERLPPSAPLRGHLPPRGGSSEERDADL